MKNHLRPFLDKHFGPHFVLLLKQQVVGLFQDFWVDGPDNLLGLDFASQPVIKGPFLEKFLKSKNGKASTAAQTKPHEMPQAVKNAREQSLWHAAPGEISEKMWGAGFVTPGDVTINSLLITPLGLNKTMSVLDLSAGLGGRMRHASEETGAYITGLEPDAAIADRAMQLSIMAGKSKHAPVTHYDPARLACDRSYDAFIARETFYRVPDRPAFFATIAKNAKPQAQLAFTDYVLDPEHRTHPAIMAWQKYETLANPMGLVETSEVWAKVGFALTLHEDLTSFYKVEVATGIKRFLQFLASGVRPDKETAQAVLRRIEMWKHRMAALEAGLKFYRFYGKKR